VPDLKRLIAFDIPPRESRSDEGTPATEPPVSGVRRAQRRDCVPQPRPRNVGPCGPPLAASRATPASSRIVGIDTRDLGEAQQIFSRLYAEATLEPIPKAPFGCVLDVAGQGPVRTVEGYWAGGFRAVTVSGKDRYVLSLSIEGHLQGEQGGKPALCVPGQQATMFSPEYAARVEVNPGYWGLSFVIERASLEAQFRALTGRETHDALMFDPIHWLDGGATGALLGILQLYRREVKRAESSPIWLTGLRDALLTSVLANTQNSATTMLNAPPPRVAPGSVRRAEEFIEAHAGEAITLTDIVTATGVPARSLRATFATSRGVTPMEYLRQCRLDLGRRMLLEGDEGTTVASVVRALGLGAAGRFSVEYRKRFGESPSETLAAARGRVSRVTPIPCAAGSGRKTS